jgi:N-ethylmaleimide reductase
VREIQERHMSQVLLSSYQLGSLTLPNRIVMAPMTRSRGDNPDAAADDLVAEYYAQRAAAGLIISEGTNVSPRGVGYVNVPGIWSAAQVAGWRKVAAAVHERGGRIFAQLWHVGAISHPDLLQGRLPLAPSAINPDATAFTRSGFARTVTPAAMSGEEITATVAEFRQAAANAMTAGFDGVELHAANGYLFQQFIARSMNARTDAYGGSIPNRCRFLLDVLSAVRKEVPASRIGVKINPTLDGLSGIVFDDETLPLYEFLADRLWRERIGYLHVMEPINSTERLPRRLVESSVASFFRPYFRSGLIGGVDYTRESANSTIADGVVDLVAFGRAFIANPDLVARFDSDLPLAEPDRSKFYTGGAAGYTDYPTYAARPGETPRAENGARHERYSEARRSLIRERA